MNFFRTMNRTVGTTLFLLILAATTAADEIAVSAAASLKECLNAVIVLYEKEHPGTKIVPNYAASGVLAKQIENGSPADVFISADEKWMDVLAEKKLIAAETRIKLLKNTLVLIVPLKGNSPVASFADLATDKLKINGLAVGDPKSVPAGTYAMEVFASLNITEQVKPKTVYGASVRAVLAYVALNEVDAGIVYATDAKLFKEKVKVVAAAPEKTHTPVIYPAAVISGGTNTGGGRAFLKYLSSPNVRKVFQEFGFAFPSLNAD